MFKLVLLFLTLSGLQAVPIAAPSGLQKTASNNQLSDGFQHGSDHFDIRNSIPDGFERDIELSRRGGIGEMDRRHWLTDEVPDDIPVQKSGGSWVRVEEPSSPQLPDGFKQGTEHSMRIQDGFRQGTEHVMRIPDDYRQGTEPFMRIPDDYRQGTESFMRILDGFRQGTEPSMRIQDGFRQGTEPFMKIQDGFRQGTEPFMKIPDAFRQGTEPFMRIPDAFRQGTEPLMRIPDAFRQGTEHFMKIPDGFRQGTEPLMRIPEAFRQGTEPFMKIPDGFRQGTEPLLTVPEGFRQGTEPSVQCKGEIFNRKCYEFIPTPLAFKDAQALCRDLGPNAELASIPNSDLHSRLVSLVTKGGKNNPVLTWLGGTIKNQQASWADGSEWSYSDWMPEHPNIQSDKPVCIEMFKIDESWWTAADCELKRASICSYPVTG